MGGVPSHFDSNNKSGNNNNTSAPQSSRRRRLLVVGVGACLLVCGWQSQQSISPWRQKGVAGSKDNAKTLSRELESASQPENNNNTSNDTVSEPQPMSTTDASQAENNNNTSNDTVSEPQPMSTTDAEDNNNNNTVSPRGPRGDDVSPPVGNYVGFTSWPTVNISSNTTLPTAKRGNRTRWKMTPFNHSVVVQLDYGARLVTNNTNESDAVVPDRPHLYLDTTPVFDSPAAGRVAVCAHSKNETLYIDEWADYHLALGFDLFICDNTDEFELRYWRRTPPHNKRIHVAHLPGEAMQRYGYKACHRHVRRTGYHWVAFFDLDEFLVLPAVLDAGGNMTSFSTATIPDRKSVQTLPPPKSIMEDFGRRYVRPRRPLGINWKIFGTSDHQHYEKRPLVERFQRPIETHDNEDWKIKTIAVARDLNMTAVYSPHKLELNNVGGNRGRKRGAATQLVDTNGKRINSPSNKYGPLDVVRFHHYKYKSAEEYIVKRRRGRGFAGGVIYLDTALLGLDQDGSPLPSGIASRDPTAWQILKKLVPEYQAWEMKTNALPNTPE